MSGKIAKIIKNNFKNLNCHICLYNPFECKNGCKVKKEAEAEILNLIEGEIDKLKEEVLDGSFPSSSNASAQGKIDILNCLESNIKKLREERRRWVIGKMTRPMLRYLINV